MLIACFLLSLILTCPYLFVTTYCSISIYLIEKGYKTSKDRKFSDYQQVRNILTNEIYIGRITYGKTFIKLDGLEKKSVINNGEQPKYIINNHHEAIIDKETY